MPPTGYIAAGDINAPVILFLHGFLGSKEDWLEIIKPLSSRFFCLAPDLPGHGPTPFFPDFCERIRHFLAQWDLKQINLIGYSMGGRIALQLAEKDPKRFHSVILISAHPGLKDPIERDQRWQQDLAWIDLLKTTSISAFLEQWYAQPLFASLKRNKRLYETLLERRKKSEPHTLAAVMHAFSLGKQPAVSFFHPHTLFILGKEDLKFAAIYRTLPAHIAVETIEGAGHAAHLENPMGCSETIEQWVRDHVSIGYDTNS